MTGGEGILYRIQKDWVGVATASQGSANAIDGTVQWLDANCGISRVTARGKVRVARALADLDAIPRAFEPNPQKLGG